MEEIINKIHNNILLTDEEIHLFIEYVVVKVNEIINDESMTNKCDLAQGLIGRYLTKLNISYSACLTNSSIMPDVIGHSFITMTYNGQTYLIDPAFRQFKVNNREYRDLYINNSRCLSISPYETGIKINKKVIEELVSKGYLKLTNEIAKVYGDTFYHTLTGISPDYQFMDIPGDVYLNSFLKGHERLRKYDEYQEINDIERGSIKL